MEMKERSQIVNQHKYIIFIIMKKRLLFTWTTPNINKTHQTTGIRNSLNETQIKKKQIQMFSTLKMKELRAYWSILWLYLNFLMRVKMLRF